MRSQMVLLVAVLSLAALFGGAMGASRPTGLASLVDSRLGTARAFGSNVLGPCVPYGSAHPSPDSLWPTPHPGAKRRTWTIAGPKKGSPLRDSGLIGPVRVIRTPRGSARIVTPRP